MYTEIIQYLEILQYLLSKQTCVVGFGGDENLSERELEKVKNKAISTLLFSEVELLNIEKYSYCNYEQYGAEMNLVKDLHCNNFTSSHEEFEYWKIFLLQLHSIWS